MKNDPLPILLLALCLIFLAWHFLHLHRIKVLTEEVIRLQGISQKP